MKMRAKRFGAKWSAAVLTAACVVGLTACGANQNSSSPSYNTLTTQSKGESYYGAVTEAVTGGTAADNGWSDGYYEAEESVASDRGSGSALTPEAAASAAYLDSRKLIKTVDLEVETKAFDDLMSELDTQIENLGGYIENMYTYNGSDYSNSRVARNADLTVRIPKQKLKDFTDRVSEIGNVVSRSEDVKDVTLSYVDTESQRDSLRIQQERLLDLLEQADNLEDMLTIEDRLTRVRYQLENMESQLRTYDNKVDFATVYLSVCEVKELTPVIEEEETPWERMTGGFMDSLKDVGEGLLNFGIWIVVHLPYLFVWAVIIIGIVLIIKGLIRHKKKKKAAALERMIQTDETVAAKQVQAADVQKKQ